MMIIFNVKSKKKMDKLLNLAVKQKNPKSTRRRSIFFFFDCLVNLDFFAFNSSTRAVWTIHQVPAVRIFYSLFIVIPYFYFIVTRYVYNMINIYDHPNISQEKLLKIRLKVFMTKNPKKYFFQKQNNYLKTPIIFLLPKKTHDKFFPI